MYRLSVTLRNYQPVAWVWYQRVIDQSKADIFVTASEIVDFIQILDLKKASGPDKISRCIVLTTGG
jgi:hypothetical protein